MARTVRKGIHVALALALAFASRQEVIYGIPAEHALAGAAILLLAVFLAARYVHLFDRLRTVHAQSAGDLYFALGVLVCAQLFVPEHAHAFFGAMLVLGLADAGASLAGGFPGTHEYRVAGERRTWEGTGVVLFVSTIVLWMSGIEVSFAFAGGALLAACEALATRGSDNFFLPLLAGALLAIG